MSKPKLIKSCRAEEEEEEKKEEEEEEEEEDEEDLGHSRRAWTGLIWLRIGTSTGLL